jgi:hypothetical protein
MQKGWATPGTYDLTDAKTILVRLKEKHAPGAYKADKKRAATALLEAVFEFATSQGYDVKRQTPHDDPEAEWLLQLRGKVPVLVEQREHSIRIGPTLAGLRSVSLDYDPVTQLFVAPGASETPDAAKSAGRAIAAAIKEVMDEAGVTPNP